MISTYKIQTGHTIHMVKGAAKPAAESAAAQPTQRLPTNMGTGLAAGNVVDGVENYHHVSARYKSQLTDRDSLASTHSRAWALVTSTTPMLCVAAGRACRSNAQMAGLMDNPEFLRQMSDLLSRPEVVDQVSQLWKLELTADDRVQPPASGYGPAGQADDAEPHVPPDDQQPRDVACGEFATSGSERS